VLREHNVFRQGRQAGQSTSIWAVLDDAAFRAATEVMLKFLPPADPAARWTGAHWTFSREAFTYDQVNDTYVCPWQNAGHDWHTGDDGATQLYQASKT
jgi:hypothetical protein